jgi:hypothetical protein
MLIVLIVLLLLFGGGGGYYWGSRGDPNYGPRFGLGGVLVVLLVMWVLGFFGAGPHFRW